MCSRRVVVFLCGAAMGCGPSSQGRPDAGVTETCAAAELAPCSDVAGAPDADGVILRGTVVGPDRLLCSGDVLYSRSSGTIACVADDCSADPAAAGAPVVCAPIIA